MTPAAGLVVDFILRAVGAFYVFGSIVGLRMAATDYLMMQALSALGNPDPRETRAERQRGWWLVANLLFMGLGGVALVMLLDVAAFLFAVSAAFNALYLFVLAPRLFDPYDPPEEPGRSRTWNAFWIYLAATALVLAAWWTACLTPVARAHPLLLTIAAGAGLALLVYGMRLMLRMRMKGDHRSMPWKTAMDNTATETADDGETTEELIARIRQTPLVMRPSLKRGAFFDARNGAPIDMPIYDDFTVEDDKAISKWLTLFADNADSTDPFRCALRDPESVTLIANEGRPLFERLVARMGPERIRFEPQAAPVTTKHADVTRIKLMADYPNHPIWMIEDDRYEAIDPDEFGISWQLARDIGTWEMDYADSYDPDDPDAPSKWNDAEYDRHEERGRRLAVRLARELAATGRAHVLVNTFVRSTGVVPVRPDDAID